MLETTLCLTLQVRKIDHFPFSETGKHIVRGLRSRCNLMLAGPTDHANFFDYLFVDFNICSSSTVFECNYSLVQQGFSFLSAASIHTLPHKCLPHVNILQFRVYLQRLLCRNVLCSKFKVLVSSREALSQKNYIPRQRGVFFTASIKRFQSTVPPVTRNLSNGSSANRMTQGHGKCYS